MVYLATCILVRGLGEEAQNQALGVLKRKMHLQEDELNFWMEQRSAGDLRF